MQRETHHCAKTSESQRPCDTAVSGAIGIRALGFTLVGKFEDD